MVSKNQVGQNSLKVTFSLSQIGGIVLIILNTLIVIPGGWTINKIWENTKQFRTDTKQELDQLKNDLTDLEVKFSANYVTKQEFMEYRSQMVENIRYIDSKLP